MVANNVSNDSKAEKNMISFFASQRKGLNKVVKMATGLPAMISDNELETIVPEKLAMLLSSAISAWA